MELQFEKQEIDYLRQALGNVKDQELTQEIRLTDAMPDVGRVLAGWGQPVLRSKEWQGSQIGASGGVMVWVLYAPEDGSDPRVVEGWLPFQMKWDVRADREGPLRILPLVRFVDGRNVSARKILVRAGLSCLAEGLCRSQAEVYRSPEPPEDVQLLRRSYPVRLPKEAGEKSFDVDENLNKGNIAEILSYSLQPGVAEQRVHGDKVVIRGAGDLHLVYRCTEGRICTSHFEIPFSQFAELERPYGADAMADVIAAVTGLEVALGDEGLNVKASLAAQYIVSDRTMLELVEDAYSTRRDVGLRQEELMLPSILDETQERVNPRAAFPDARDGMDLTFWPGFPRQRREGDKVELTLPGRFQLLGRDGEGKLRGWQEGWEGTVSLAADEANRTDALFRSEGAPQMITGGRGMEGRADGQVRIVSTSRMGLPMLTSLELGAIREPDELRPSLILCRSGGKGLWSLAKASGSTVDAIRLANDLTDDEDDNRMILIPVS
ncbi:MAG: DUF3794 domain-containing protein [Oscillospiraceae bacterium]|nr:DUF3794 domain-containing protein [Oscillospiraceae bacterium]